jgi:glycosyltransferase involved in cell wall biosynthesis
MYDSLRQQHPAASLTVLLLDGDGDDAEGLDDARILGLDAAVGDDSGLIAAANPLGALEIAVLPYLIRVMFGFNEQTVTYIGAGQRLMGPLTDLFHALDHHEIVLVARGSERASAVAGRDDFRRGAYSRHLLGFRNGECTDALLDAWPRYFTVSGDNGAGAVRAWIDRIPAIASGVGVLRDPGYAFDRWTSGVESASSVHDADSETSTVTVDSRPVRVVDLSELDPNNPLSWFAHEDGVRATAVPSLIQVITQVAEELRSSSQAVASGAMAPVPYARLDDGLRLTDLIRSLLVRAISGGAVTRSPFTEEGRSEFYRYLNEPDGRARTLGLTRLHMAIWESRADLRSAYPHIDGPDGEGYAGWLCTHGAKQEGVVPELMPPTPPVAYRDADPNIGEAAPRWGANVVGFFTSELGVGEVARLIVSALDARGVPALPVQGNLVPPSRQLAEFSYGRPDDAPYPINIVCINGDGIPVFAREAGRSFFDGRYTIALWWWEVGEPPPSWTPAYEFVDEVWVASQHIYDVVASSSPVPVIKITMPLAEPEVAEYSRTELGLPPDGFLFLYVHDYHSVAARKNPVGLIEAFRRAFEPDSGAKLVLKSMNAGTRVDEHDRVILAARGRPDITLIDAYASAAEKNAMIAHCDCYASLHRSEGFGLTAAEAMLLSKPVIATRYGGNLEYMNDANAYLVDYTPVCVGEGVYPYPAKGEWADPDLDQAAEFMQRVFSNAAERTERGRLARCHMLAQHSLTIAGAAVEKRLALVAERLYRAGARKLSLPHMRAHAQDEASQPEYGGPPLVDWGGGRLGRLRWRTHRPVADWIRAYVDHQSEVDAATRNAISRMDARIVEIAQALHEELNAQHAELLAEMRRQNLAISESGQRSHDR